MTDVLTHHAVSLVGTQPSARWRRSTVREPLTICRGCQSIFQPVFRHTPDAHGTRLDTAVPARIVWTRFAIQVASFRVAA
jgi:hypothetical protein